MIGTFLLRNAPVRWLLLIWLESTIFAYLCFIHTDYGQTKMSILKWEIYLSLFLRWLDGEWIYHTGYYEEKNKGINRERGSGVTNCRLWPSVAVYNAPGSSAVEKNIFQQYEYQKGTLVLRDYVTIRMLLSIHRVTC